MKTYDELEEQAFAVLRQKKRPGTVAQLAAEFEKEFDRAFLADALVSSGECLDIPDHSWQAGHERGES